MIAPPPVCHFPFQLGTTTQNSFLPRRRTHLGSGQVLRHILDILIGQTVYPAHPSLPPTSTKPPAYPVSGWLKPATPARMVYSSFAHSK